ncbi:gag-pol polyprotein [Cucumis melo var. makuwa]|uniref:Gag-pol polyprotein n=1 Tax=Cucumis melo var. makuwa TaxID=1194695 RepID=A0A5A7T2M1_CUCMM|nr:gag-pol polyprotein [Cucumis melo var. makuwa]TYK30841.1 gag-pol polyprotein [Cucumis melo var. makuwa]
METSVTLDVTSTLLKEMPKDDSQPDSMKTNSKITYEVVNNETMLVPSAHVKKNHPPSSIIAIKPTSVENALKDEYWINVMQEELLQFKRNDVWTLVPKPDGANIIGTKWIFRNKTDESGCVIRNRARLVAQGYAQVEGVGFDETFAPVARLEAILLLLSVSYFRKFKLYQMDIKSAFLNGYLNEEVYVAQPKGFIDSEFPQYVYKLNKALYGLKQAPRAWYECLTMYLGKKGYSKGETDKTLFINKTNIDLIVAQIYVDDIIFGGFPKILVNNFIDIIKSEFEMSLVGELSYFLGLQIKQRSEGIFISQEKYAKNIVKKFCLDQSQDKRTPAATHAKITKDSIGTAVDHKLYRSMIGSLLYLIASRPDIVYAVGICARYQSDPRISHLNAVKRIIKYVHGTTNFEILYSYDTSSEQVRYCDADWAGSADDRKSTSAEAEYIAARSGCTQLIWMRNMLNEYGIIQDFIILKKIQQWLTLVREPTLTSPLRKCVKLQVQEQLCRHMVYRFITRKAYSGGNFFDTTDWDEATDGFFVDRELASKILNSLTAKSRSLSTTISLLSERHLEIDSLIRHLKTFAPSSSRGDPSSN